MKASIAKFSALTKPEVVEQIDTTWDAWLDWLADPAPAFLGQMEHGGWSPVVFDPPKRLKDNVRSIGALVLDHDKQVNFDRIVAAWTHCYGIVYTTKTAGHARVVLPFARSVTDEEYARLWAWGALRVAECPVDPQCKDVSRFWYDPSVPTEGAFRVERLRGVILDPDTLLAELKPPELRVVPPPVPIAAGDRERRARAYVRRIAGAVAGSHGHTATFNAVAHVMIGFDLDVATTRAVIADEFNPRCEPPWSDRELDHKLASVAERCTRDRGYLLTDRPRVQSTQQAAAHAPPAPPELEVNWLSLLRVKKDGAPIRGFANVLVFVRHHPEYRGRWALDTMTERPWFDGARVEDTFVHEIRAAIDRRLGFSPSREDVIAAIELAAKDRPFHPVQRYLRSLDWDGEPRLSAMARDYLGSDANHDAVMLRAWMIGAVARALRPGCKLDTTLMLVGRQGARKSTFFNVLGGSWHVDTTMDITNKDAYEQLHASWIYEWPELETVVGQRLESRVKAFLASAHDTYRAPYARSTQRKARGMIFCGTTNKDRFLTDDTGSRRFWIVRVADTIPYDLLAQCRDQLWAEAVSAFESGEMWWLDAATDAARAETNEHYQDEDPWESIVGEFLAVTTRSELTVAELLEAALKVEPAKQGRWEQMRVSKLLKTAGWIREQYRMGGQRCWRYRREAVSS